MNIAKTIDAYLDIIQAIILSLLMKLGPFIVALMPAAFTGYAIYHIFKEGAGAVVASLFALIVSVAFETVGIVATHTAVDLYNGWEGKYINPVKFWVMTTMIPFYVVAVIFTVWFAGDAFPPLVQALGFVSPALVVVIQVAVALARDLSEIKRGVSGKRSEIRETRQATKKDSLERFRITEASRVQIEVAKRQVTEPLPQVTEYNGKVAATLPQWCDVEPKNRPHFRQLVTEGKIRIPAGITGPDFLQQLPIVGSIRSATNWLGDARANGRAE